MVNVGSLIVYLCANQCTTASYSFPPAQRPREIGSNSPAAGTVLRCLKAARIDAKLPTLD